MRKYIVRVIVIFTMVLSVNIAGCSKTAVPEEIPFVRSQTINLDREGYIADYSGEVRGRYETRLAFQVGGKIIRRNVDLGSKVKQGDVLLEIDAKDIQQTVNISLAQVASAKSQLILAEANLKRYHLLYEQGAISQALFDQYQNAYEVASAAVHQATAQYAQGANQLGYSTLLADSDGIVSAINAEPGQVFGAGQHVLTLVKDGEREIEINVPENRLGQIRNARQIHVSFWALPGIVAAGKVREISPMADKVTRTYKVRIRLIDCPEGVDLGMTSNVKVAGISAGQAVYIPIAAIYQTGDVPCVWVVKDGTVSLRPVKVGEFGDGKILVTEGLADAEVIVTNGVQKLREGQKVRL